MKPKLVDVPHRLLPYGRFGCPLVESRSLVVNGFEVNDFVEAFRAANKLTLDKALQLIASWDDKEAGWELHPDVKRYASDLACKVRY